MEYILLSQCLSQYPVQFTACISRAFGGTRKSNRQRNQISIKQQLASLRMTNVILILMMVRFGGFSKCYQSSHWRPIFTTACVLTKSSDNIYFSTVLNVSETSLTLLSAKEAMNTL